MDIQTGLLCIVVVIVSGGVLLFISRLSMREKTYEEAIAEQRKMPADSLLLRRPDRTKSKDKKPQRSGKKVKEKKKEQLKRQSSTESEEITESEPLHVKIVPTAEVLGEKKPEASKKKKNKVKPILVNRENDGKVNSAITESDSSLSANHFEVTQPKDDLSLRKTNIPRAEVNDELGPSGDVVVPKDKKASKAEKSPSKGKGEKHVKEEVIAEVQVVPTEEVPVIQSKVSSAAASASSTPVESSPILQSKVVKEKKKAKKPDPNLHQAPVTLLHISSLIRQAELSPNERQILTDLLLNDQLDVEHSEWSEGQQLAKLKKQLGEKEQALANEQASCQAFQAKLKEIRAELNDERSKSRQFEESYLGKVREVQQHHARELQAYIQECQQLQKKVKDSEVMILTLQETAQARQQDALTGRQQLQQMEMLFRESENNLKAQLHAATSSYNAEVQKSRCLDEELREAIANFEALKENNTAVQDITRKLEDTERAKKEIEKALNDSLKKQEDLSFEKKRLTKEILELTSQLSESRKEVQFDKNRLQSEIHSLTNQLSEKLDKHKVAEEILKAEVEKAKSETQKVKSELAQVTDEKNHLDKECQRLKAEVANIGQVRTAGDGRENGGKNVNLDFINHENDSKKKDIIVEKLEGELKEKASGLEKAEKALKEKETKLVKLEKEVEEKGKSVVNLEKQLADSQKTVAKLQSELTETEPRIQKTLTELSAVQQELVEQKTKNNELRVKNWKTVNALGDAEKALDNQTKQTDVTVAKAKAEVEEMTTALLKRLLPEVKVDKKNFNEWLTSFEAAAAAVLSGLRTAQSVPQEDRTEDWEKQVAQLQADVARYKTIIDDTMGMLNKLQSHIEVEELRWTELLDARQAEVNSLKGEQSTLKAQLLDKEKAIEDLRGSLEPLRSKLSEDDGKLQSAYSERDALQSKLASEQDRLKELNKEIVKLRSNLKIGQDSYEAEHKIRLELEERIKAIKEGVVDNSNESSIAVTHPIELPSSQTNSKKKKSNKNKAKNGADGNSA